MDAALTVVALVVVLYAGWRLSVWRWPTRRCPACSGSGKNSGSNTLRWGHMPPLRREGRAAEGGGPQAMTPAGARHGCQPITSNARHPSY